MNLNDLNRQPPRFRHGGAHGLPLLVRMSHAPKTFGPSRSQLYRWAASGEIVVRKIGAGTYVETESVLKRMAELPLAKIGGKGAGQ